MIPMRLRLIWILSVGGKDVSEKFYFLGGGGFAIELYEYMSSENIEILGYYAQSDSPDLSVYIPWMGDMDEKEYADFDRDAKYILAVRLIKYRDKMIRFMDRMNLEAGSFVSSLAYRSRFAKLGKGAVVFPNAMITGNPVVGDFLFMDAFSIISHGDIMGNNIVIGPGVIVTGDSEIGNGVTFGVNSAILPGTKIGNNVEIAINTYPRRRVPDGSSIIAPPGKSFGKNLNKNFDNKGTVNTVGEETGHD